MIKLENVSKSFGKKKVIKNLSLEVPESEIFTFIGESGCGKTTVLRMIAGFELPDEGQILIGGEDLLPLSVEQRPVGFVFQNYALFPHLSVYDNIAVGPRVCQISEEDIEKKIQDILEATHLKGLHGAYPGQLSGGESQRVAIARAIINRPKILLLDEPFSALDPSLRKNLREQLVDMQKGFGTTFLMVTHDQEEALSLSHRVGVLKDGHLQQIGSPQQLYNHPVNAYVAGFLGNVNRLDGTVESQTGSRLWVNVDFVGRLVCESKIERKPGSPVTLFIRPEKTFISFKRSAGPSDNEVDGLLVKSSFYGSYSQYQVILKNSDTFHVLAPQGTEDRITPPQRSKIPVSLFLNPQDIFLLDEMFRNANLEPEEDWDDNF